MHAYTHPYHTVCTHTHTNIIQYARIHTPIPYSMPAYTHPYHTVCAHTHTQVHIFAPGNCSATAAKLGAVPTT